MKPDNTGSGKTGSSPRKPGAHGRVPVRIPQIPMEWMDPMSWRLPSGKALAEFAPQAGFLAPLMIGSPRLKKKKTAPPAAPSEVIEKGLIDKGAKEAPGLSGTFRARRY